MTLIAMATYCTEDNRKAEYLDRTLESLWQAMNGSDARLFVIDNSPGNLAKKVLTDWEASFGAWNAATNVTLIDNKGNNVGTANAINQAWQHRREGENAVKMDDDVVIYDPFWVEKLEEAIRRDPHIGIIGLKRKDCIEHPNHNDPFYKSELRMLHRHGQPWMVVEDVNHVMGTCQMYSAELLAKIGYLYQPRLYGFDDSLAAIRCKVAGFKNCFLPDVEIDHIDPGDTPFQKWKEKSAGEDMAEYNLLKDAYLSGKKDVYFNPFDKK
jgi:GT2 family glycosyltransferase